MNLRKPGRRTVTLILVIAALAAIALYLAMSGTPAAGSKTITIEIYHMDGTSKTTKITTVTATLRAALEQANLVGGQDSDYGLFVTEIDGVSADADKHEEWSCRRPNGTEVSTSLDTTPIKDGDVFVFTHETAR